jgi:quinolinate synthase
VTEQTRQRETAERIRELSRRKGAVILAHVYTRPEVQDVADYVGDSLGLSQKAASGDSACRIILFCGVHFMAETAAILCPGKTVLVPDPEAGCPMASMVSARDVRQLRAEHPRAMVACYVNSTVEVKAESDVCVTSSNALKIVRQLPAGEVIFVPDRSLGAYVQSQLKDKKIILWPGYCPTHHRMIEAFVHEAKSRHPGALVLAHPENTPDVLALADFIGSTGQIQSFAAASSAKEFIVASENGLLYRLGRDNPGKRFHEVTPLAVCPNMKKTTLAKILGVLEREDNVVRVEGEVRDRALAAVNRMLEMSK